MEFSQIPEVNVHEALSSTMFKVDGKYVQVLNWQGFQVDTTNSERQKRHRALVTDEALQPLHNDYNAYRTGQDSTLAAGSDEKIGEHLEHFTSLSPYARASNIGSIRKGIIEARRQYSDEEINVAIKQGKKERGED